MMCERCGKRPATVHVTRITNNEKIERYLCEQCAQQDEGISFVMGQPFSVNSLLAGMLHQHAYGLAQKAPDERQPRTTPAGPAEARCGKCGMAYGEFAQTGRLGCGTCYEEFDRRLDPLLRRIHANPTHSGKSPRRAGRHTQIEREATRLRRELERCVAEERYEQAAVIRDKIRELEAKRA